MNRKQEKQPENGWKASYKGATMSILIFGKSRCPLCRKIIRTDEIAVSLPAFVWNEADPLLIFNDVSIHRQCYETHPMKSMVDKVLSDMEANIGPGKRQCRGRRGRGRRG